MQISINEDLRQIRETLSQASGPTAARDTVQALGDLVQAQNLFIGVWVNYEALRRNLDLDLGTMEIDPEGLWIDPGPIRMDTLGCNLGPAILNYGLSEDEIRLQQMMAESTADAPVELRPTAPVELDATQSSPLEPLIPDGGQPGFVQPAPQTMLPVSYQSPNPVDFGPQVIAPPPRQ